MGPVDVIDVFEYIGNMKRDNTHRIVEGLLVEMCICSTLDFTLSWRRCRTFDNHRYQVVPVTNAASDISDMAQQSRPVCQNHVYKGRRRFLVKHVAFFVCCLCELMQTTSRYLVREPTRCAGGVAVASRSHR